jgi:HEAT repeat protein
MRILSAANLLLTSAFLLAGPFISVEAETSGPAFYRGQPLSFYVSRLHATSTRAEALRSIGSFGPQAVPALPQLVEALRDSDVEARIASAWALSQVAQSMDERAVKALTQVLADPDPKVRSLAAVALREAGPGAVDAVSALITALNDSAAYVRAPAADALGKIGPAARAAVASLTKRLKAKDEQVFVLRSISTALGNIGPDAKSALPALTEVRKMVRVSYAAEEAIHRIKGEPVAGYW